MSFPIDNTNWDIGMSYNMFDDIFFNGNENAVPLENLPPIPLDFKPNALVEDDSSNQRLESTNKSFPTIVYNNPPTPIYIPNLIPPILNPVLDSNLINEKRGIKRKEFESSSDMTQPFKRIKQEDNKEIIRRRELNKRAAQKSRLSKKNIFNNLIDEKKQCLQKLESLKVVTYELSGKCHLFYELFNPTFSAFNVLKHDEMKGLIEKVDNLSKNIIYNYVTTELASLEKQKKIIMQDTVSNASIAPMDKKARTRLISQKHRKKINNEITELTDEVSFLKTTLDQLNDEYVFINKYFENMKLNRIILLNSFNKIDKLS